MPGLRDYAGQKWLGWLDDMGELEWPLSIPYRMKFARDGFASRDTLQKLSADRFFHRRVYAKSLQSCSRVCVLAPSAITLGIVFGEADPPKVERVVLNALVNNGPKGRTYNARPIAAATARRRGTSSAKISGVSA